MEKSRAINIVLTINSILLLGLVLMAIFFFGTTMTSNSINTESQIKVTPTCMILITTMIISLGIEILVLKKGKDSAKKK